MHKNYHIFTSDTHYQMGLLMGKKFYKQAQNALLTANKDNWQEKVEVGRKMLKLTQKHFPEYIDELNGYAKGADVNFLDLWIFSIEDDVHVESQAKCTAIITDNGKLIGHTEDASDPGQENTICIVKKTLKGLTTLEIYYYNTLGGSAIGINSFGYVLSINSLLFTKPKMGIPKNIIARYLLDTQNPDKSIKEVLKLPRATGYNHNIISKEGRVWNLELTADDGILVNPQLPFVHTNHCLNVKGPEVNNYHGTDSRLYFAEKHTKGYMSSYDMEKLLEDVSQGPNESLFNERTIGKMIIDFNNMIAKIWLLREKNLGWVDYPLDFISSPINH